jgi:hypothetical protein
MELIAFSTNEKEEPVPALLILTMPIKINTLNAIVVRLRLLVLM